MRSGDRQGVSIDPVYRAIAHSGRRELLTRLREAGGLTLGELCADFAMTRQAVSQHLAMLEQAGLVVTRRHGREKLHYLNAALLYEAYQGWLAPMITREARSLVDLKRTLERQRPGKARRRSRQR